MKNSHLSKYNLTAFALTALTFIPFMASSGWATIIEGNLEVKAGAGASSSNGDLTVEGTTTLKGITNINGSINANDTLTLAADKKLTANGDLEVEGITRLNGNTFLGNEANDVTNINGNLEVSGSLTVDGVTHAGVPVGTVIWHVGICGTTTPTANTSCTCPSGYLKANGDPLGSEYTTLRELLGTTLPDLRGEFIRGWSDGRAVNSNRVIRSSEGDSYKSHRHNLSKGSMENGGGRDYGGYPQIDISNLTTNTASDAISFSGDTETRPRNVALLACIKF